MGDYWQDQPGKRSLVQIILVPRKKERKNCGKAEEKRKISERIVGDASSSSLIRSSDFYPSLLPSLFSHAPLSRESESRVGVAKTALERRNEPEDPFSRRSIG